MGNINECHKEGCFKYPCCDTEISTIGGIEKHETNTPNDTIQIYCPYCRQFTELKK